MDITKAEWQPDDSNLQNICQLLAEYQKPGSNQTQIYQKFHELCSKPDINNYLVYLLAYGYNFSVEVRQSAGLLLKNNLRSIYLKLSEENREYIKKGVVNAMSLPSRPLRQTAGTAAAMIASMSGYIEWPDLIKVLGLSIESGDLNQQEGALDTTFKICEDCPKYIEVAILGDNSSIGLGFIQLLLNKTKSSDSNEIKRLAISILNLISRDLGPSHDSLLDMYRESLFSAATSEDCQIRKEVCAGMIQMLIYHQEKLMPYLKDIIAYMLSSTQDSDGAVALESCEFWMAFVEAQMDPNVLRPFLPQLLPILLKNMVYEDDDETVLLTLEAEEDIKDMEKDIKPYIASNHTQRSSPRTSSSVSSENVYDADQENINGGWTLRKSSAGGLDLLSMMFGDELLTIIMPIIEKRLQDNDWKERESAILVLGAISEGCHKGLEPYLDDIIKIIINKLNDPVPMVRIISCWTLSRYADRVIMKEKQNKENAKEEVDLVFTSILEKLLDKNKKVQEAACSSLATIEEIANTALFTRIKIITEHLAAALRIYDEKNIRLVYDALSTLAEKVGNVIGGFKDVVMPPLLDKWKLMSETDLNLPPLISCFTVLAINFGNAFENYLQPMFNMCISIINMQIQTGHAIAANQAISIPYEPDLIISSLDFISGMLEGLPQSLKPLITDSNLCEFLLESCQHLHPDVRQSAFALIGDLARFDISLLDPNIKDFCHLSLQNFDTSMLREENMSACNNACWALGEMAVRTDSSIIKPIGIMILEKLTYILINSRMMPRSMKENAAITMGRVSIVCAEEAAPHLPIFIGPWCQMLQCIRDDIEKEQAFTGLLKLIKLNPQGATPSFISFCQAISSWHHVTCNSLLSEIINVMDTFKKNFTMQGRWPDVLSDLSEPTKMKLNIMFDL